MRRCSWPPVLLRCASVSVEHVAHAGGPNSTEDSGCLAGGRRRSTSTGTCCARPSSAVSPACTSSAQVSPKSIPASASWCHGPARTSPRMVCVVHKLSIQLISKRWDPRWNVSANPRLDRKDNGARAQMQAGIGIASWHTILLLLVRHKVREVPLPQLQFHVLERPNVTRTSVHLHEQALALSPAQLPTCCPTGQAA